MWGHIFAMEENLSLRFGFWPSVILLTDHYVLVSTQQNSCHSVLASLKTAGGIFLIPGRFEGTMVFPDMTPLEFHKYFKFAFSSCILQT